MVANMLTTVERESTAKKKKYVCGVIMVDFLFLTISSSVDV